MSDDILSDEEKAALAVGPGDDEVEEGQQPPEQQTEDEKPDERPRDEHGRFVKTDEGEPQGEDQEKKGGTVPQGALHAERERRKAAEARADEAQKVLDRIAELRAGKQAQGGEQQQGQQEGEDEVAFLKRRLSELEQGQKQTANYLQGQQLDQAEHQQLVSVLSQRTTAGTKAQWRRQGRRHRCGNCDGPEAGQVAGAGIGRRHGTGDQRPDHRQHESERVRRALFDARGAGADR
jgi:hypothetical protein